MKYEILKKQSLQIFNTTLFRIRALRDIGKVKAGTIGGFIASEYNLSQEGDSWVGGGGGGCKDWSHYGCQWFV